MKNMILGFLSEATRRCNNSHVLLRSFGVYGRDSFTVFFWRFYRRLEMKRLSIILVLLAFALTLGCASMGMQFKAPDLGKAITGSGPRLVGFFVGKENPELADKIIKYCDLLAGKDEPVDFKAKLDEGIDWLLNQYLDEPYIVMELENLLPDIEIQTTEIPTPAWMDKVKPMIENFKIGVNFGSASVTTSDQGFIQRYCEIYEANYLKFLLSRGFPNDIIIKLEE